MADTETKTIVFTYKTMEDCHDKLVSIAKEYETAAQTLKTALNNAMTEWDGASKDKFQKLLTGSVYNFLEKDVPATITNMANLLKNNYESMESADQKIADQIPDKI